MKERIKRHRWLCEVLFSINFDMSLYLSEIYLCFESVAGEQRSLILIFKA